MQNITQSSRSSRVQFIAVLFALATLATFATAASRHVSDYLQTSRANASLVHKVDWQTNQTRMVACPGGENLCPGGALAPASLFVAR